MTAFPTLLVHLRSMNREKALVVGIIGGGQLGRMMALEAPRLRLAVRVLDAGGAASPCGPFAEKGAVAGGLKDKDKLKELAVGCDVVTMEIEHISVEALETLEESGVIVRPSSATIKLIQDKFVQKRHFASHGIPLPPYLDTPSLDSVYAAASTLGLPLMLKSRKEGYDGRGNAVVRTLSDIPSAFASLSVGGAPPSVYAEGWVPFTDELAVMVVRSPTGEVRCYPPVTAVQRNSVCRVVLCPARCPASSRASAVSVARHAVASLGDGAVGIFGVELFLLPDGSVLLNEIAPRPHNTGHYTQDACQCSQFENHLRAVAGLPLGSTELLVGSAAMVNVLGDETTGALPETVALCEKALTMPRAAVHWYGKDARKGRKCGHVNLTADSDAELAADLDELLSVAGLPLDGGSSGGRIPPSAPLVGVVMGSDSDLPAMAAACEMLRHFGVPFEVDVVSAHRTPDKMVAYAKLAAGRGLQVIIAGAGGAAHLPGMLASMTPLPVIGVPIKTATLSGNDSLLSIVQMPKGIPVATVAIGNAANAGLLAVRILCATRPALREKMVEYQEGLRKEVEEKSQKLLSVGVDAYLAGMGNKSGTVNV